jgi:hypothetical protein
MTQHTIPFDEVTEQFVTLRHVVYGNELHLNLHTYEDKRLWEALTKVQPTRWFVVWQGSERDEREGVWG